MFYIRTVRGNCSKFGVSRVPHVRESVEFTQNHTDQGRGFWIMDYGVRIANIVATATLESTLDLIELERKIPMSQLKPKKFSGLLIRILKPYKALAQVYSNGKITVNGPCSTPAGSLELAKRFCKLINKCGGYSCTISNFKIVNIVGTCSLHRQIELGSLSKLLESEYKCNFNPEIFPGLRLRLSDCSAVVFRTGKCNLLGGKSVEDLQAAYIELQIIIP